VPHWDGPMEVSSLSGRSWRSAQALLLRWFSRRADCGVCDGAPPVAMEHDHYGLTTR